VVAPTPAAVKLAKRWVGSTSISTTTVTTTSLAYVNGPLVFVTIPGGRLETTVTSELTVTSTSTSALQPGSGGGSSSLSGPIGSQTSSTSSTLSQGTKSGALKLGFSLLNFLMGTGFLLFVNVL
jgi:hypothetical protein